MKKDYIEEYKDKFSFLSNYGFVFSVDPHNPDKLCYKNAFGEIVLGVKYNTKIVCKYELYIQINGWKHEIDIVKEYKKYISKIILFKSYILMFKELFEFMVNKTKEFYGLKVYKSNFKPYEKPESKPIDKSKIGCNVFKVKRRSNLFSISLVLTILLAFSQVGLLGGYMTAKTYHLIFILKNITCILMLIINLLIMIMVKDYLNIKSRVLMILYPIILLLTLYYFPRRTDHLIYFISLMFSIIYLIIYCIKYFINKDSKKLSNGVLVSIYPIFVSIYKSFELENFLFFNDISVGKFLVVGAIFGLLAVILYVILKKDKTKILKYIGELLGVFCCVMFVTWLVPLFTVQNINYIFDDSIGVKNQYQITDKYTGVSSGRYHNTIYYFTILKDGVKENITVDKYIYYSYEKQDMFELYYFEGYLEDSYYEYIEELLIR